MKGKVLVILGHCTAKSFCGALAGAYAQGATEAGAEVRRLELGELNFDPILRQVNEQPLEPDLLRAQEWITWAEHLVFVYPNWWGTMPALMKGFLDRVLTADFAFRYRQDGLWDKLLEGRTADLLVTMDTPPWYYRWVFKMPGHQQMRHTVLGFCGIKVKRITEFGVVRKSTPEQRQQWLALATNLGRKV